MGRVRGYTAIGAALLLMLSGCGGSSDDEDDPPPSQAVVELPPAGMSRISSVESDSNADGHVDRIERYSYSEIGLLTRIESMTVVNDIEFPVNTIVRTYDSHSRVLEIRTRTAAEEISLKATYGADGRLATTTTTKTPATGLSKSTLMRFAWNEGRMTQVVLVKEYFESVGSFSYGDDGKIAQFKFDNCCLYGPYYYSWRTDGQLSRWTDAAELIYSRSWHYDEQGRLVEILSKGPDPAYGPEVDRFKYDDRGRPVLIETGEIDILSEVFVVGSTRRVRWEDQPCQPVYEPQMIPTVNLTTGAASPIGATLVCSNRP